MSEMIEGRNGGKIKRRQKGDPPEPGAGRPKKLPRLEHLLAEVLGVEDGSAASESEIKAVFEEQLKKAKKGDPRAAEIVLAYAYGKPKQQVEHTGQDGDPIKVTWVIEKDGSATD